MASPLGIPAGPLLNGKWLLYYANLGFDILVYKTVRTAPRECYALPNLVPVAANQLTGTGTTVPRTAEMSGSWAVSFGMPSQPPDVWRKDVEATRRQLPHGKVLVVSVVGTQVAGTQNASTERASQLDDLADDFALCAKWAIDSGAHGVEANFSCPNVATADGQLFQNPQSARQVASAIREAIGDAPLVLKIGYFADADGPGQLINATQEFVDGYAMTNSVAAHVATDDGQLLFDGQSRGICGTAILNASLEQTRRFQQHLAAERLPHELIGLGGISCVSDVLEYLNAGASSVAIATAAMLNPLIAVEIRAAWNSAISQHQSHD